jgi:hypothetical protein
MPQARLSGNDAPVNAAPFVGVPLDDLASALDFETRLAERLALLQRHRHCHVLRALAHEARRLEDDLRAPGRGSAAPGPEAVTRG